MAIAIASTIPSPMLLAAEGQFVVPAWAYPGNSSSSPAAAPRDGDALLRVPGSRATFTRAQVTDLFATPDWHPEAHPSMPDVVARGRKPAVHACGYCHLPDGQGRPENAPLAGLPAAYITAQVADIRNGVRRSAWQHAHAPTDLMRSAAEHVTTGDIALAAQYFARLRLTRRVEVVETASVPVTREAGWLYVPVEGAGIEPLGERVIEVPVDHERHELRDSALVYRAYVPVGSVARGRIIAGDSVGAPGLACVNCHGPDLRGVGLVPPLAGRSPSYVLRQLLAFRTGMRASPNGQPMATIAAQLDIEDMIATAAYVASLPP